jgi:hypothetical protein
MKGNIVTAAKLFGISLILSSLVLAVGINLAVGLNRAKPTEPTPTSAATIKASALAELFSPFFVREYSSDPNERMRELLNESGPEGQIQAEPRRFWLQSSPSTLTYERVSGALEASEPPVEVTPIQCPKE